ncbi:preprotein translocase subunit SecA [Streptobacillus moniliformis]|uniref:Protein translocase subunit SecA n=1 Tax=Streptobacillus moniliformis (strain ATCC 14647 / DSM 12112 / NCTC 10651 / 9901) TaxID=519441 RepID=D1AXS5_STRM9|nr:preprotein translocase subunit SecA [Streptobacillus moniliformis]ACZ01101.1 preprotein translocase, SecA subunit [Streptobacillus moniliformis DSM 12112]AVL42533.1 preprotein translocase subunit SecA [Streptobacillus moniliformis]SQA13757.1 preprotein translocase subunit SecA [Streptobacillus moniliformis]
MKIIDIINKIFGSSDEKIIKKMRKQVEKINELEPYMESLSDEELKAKTQEFKNRLSQGETLDDLLVEAFAVVREAAKRLTGMRIYDVQLIGSMIIHSGKIAEMKTGEGKTLMSTLAIYLNALTGKGVHVVTVNDYLAKRDRDTMSHIYDFLGLTSGVIIANLDNETRREQYNCDITYGTNNEFGFDYLRDNMVHDPSEKVQREHNYAIVDEIDSILIDEARTPLIISGPAEETTHWYDVFANVVLRLKRSYKTEEIKDKKNTIIPDEDWEDYEVDEKAKTVTITDKGIKNVEKILQIDNLYSPQYVELTHFLSQALKAKELFKRDRDYIINEKDEVIIVDEFTGRLMDGRRYSDGLHQAIEAKEHLKVAGENQTLATITLQNYFRMYKKLSGMTGTAKTEEEEFKQIYKLGVVVVPTNKPVIRKDLPDVIYQTTKAKYRAIVNKIIELFEKGQPVLVGTASIEHSELLSSYLTKARIPHEVLNAKYHEREADIIAQAGRYKNVTIATNMAGRGTDIKLGGDPDSLAVKVAERGTPEYYEAYKTYEKECQENKEKVLKAGGLFILGTERHESRRIDNQLRGRAGRQGDTGASEFYLSLEDDLMRLFGGDRLKSMMRALNIPEDEDIRHKRISKAVENAQRRIESRNFSIRKNLIEYDDVNNKQREVIYKQRDQILYNKELRELIYDMIDNTVVSTVDDILSSNNNAEWDFENLNSKIYEIYGFDLPESVYKAKKLDEIYDILYNEVKNRYDNKVLEIGEEQFSRIERYIMLEVLDQKWRQNLKDLTELREGINLQSYGQKNPVNEYKISSTDIYNDMIDGINRETTSFLLKLKLNVPEELTTVNEEIIEADNENFEFKSRRERMEENE